jgi:hypothetical protein
MAMLPAGGLDLVAGAAVVVALAGPAAGSAPTPLASGAGRPGITTPAWPGTSDRPSGPLAPVPEAGLTAPTPPAPPPAPAPPEAAVPGAPVSPPPARPNPIGHALSLLDVEARFTGITLPSGPDTPRTGLAPLDENRPGAEGDRRIGKRVWDTSRERAEATWTEGRRRGQETWHEIPGR